jgi:TldD protein
VTVRAIKTATDAQGLAADFDPQKALSTAMSRGGEFADIYVEDTKSASIVCEDGRIEKVIAGRDRGAGLRVIAGLKTFYAYTNDVTDSGLMELSRVVSGAVKTGSPGTLPKKTLSKNVAPAYDVLIDPSGVLLERKVALVKTADKAARRFSKKVRQVRIIYGDAVKRSAVFNSLGESIDETRPSLLFVCHVVAGDNGVIQTGYEPIGGAFGFEYFDDDPADAVAIRAAERGVRMLKARRAPGGAMCVVLSSEAGGTMIHEAIGHGLEADLAGQGLSVYSGKIGERVAGTSITVIDDGTLKGKRGSSFYDGEGTPTNRTVLVENGILRTYMHDRLSAMRAGLQSTGNGRRESYHHRPIPRMTNTMIAPGSLSPKAVLASVEKGLFVRKMGGGQVNTVTGDFVFEVTEGFLIEKGKIADPVRGATLTGNGPKVLNAIDMVGSDLGFGIGTCGKDGQGVPVSDAQPTLRIPEIVVGGDVSAKG